MRQVAFLTGATGTIGRELVARLLHDTDFEVVLLLHERGVGQDRSALLRDIWSLPNGMGYAERVRLLVGDVTRPDLGLPEEEYRELCRTITYLVHSAATTRFDLPLAEARRINLMGTEQVIRLACQCARLDRFGFLSTAYVAGKRIGTIGEGERRHDAGFVNSYEQSKYEAEARIEEVHADLPIAVYRLSTVLGDSGTGRVAHFTAPHQALRMMHLGLVAMLPGSPEDWVDLIPADYAATVLTRLFLCRFAPGQVFHITAPERKAYTLGEIMDESYRVLGDLDPGWARRRYPKPAIVPLDAFELFVRSAEEANNPIMQGVMLALRHFAHQLAYPKRFDRTAVLGHIPDYDERLPDVRSYYGDVVRYCLRTDWGKHG